jgi:hypothetical protein
MNRTAKILIILLCFSLCGAGTFIVSSAHEKSVPQKSDAIPVKNREIIRRVWNEV